MKALDTSAVLRFLTKDDEEKAQEVKEILEEEGAYICGEVIMEVVFVLRRQYHMRKDEVIELLEDFLTLDSVELEDGVYLEALEFWKDVGKISFPDLVIALKAQKRGVELFTFDRDLKKKLKLFLKEDEKQ